jgi:hypothetical protein
MIIETTNSIYEVRRDEKRFRRIHEFGPADVEFPVGRWFPFHRMTEPDPGEPMRFFWVIAQTGRVSRIGMCETSPIVRVLPDDETSVESYVATRRAGSAHR